MICILQDQFQGLVFPESSDSKIQPIFRASIQAYVGVSLYFDGERRYSDYIGSCDISSGEAAINDYVVGELEVGAVGMPLILFRLVLVHLYGLNKTIMVPSLLTFFQRSTEVWK